MNAIEAFYHGKGIKVLSKRNTNVVKKEVDTITKTVQSGSSSFSRRLLKNTKKTISGIKNDVLLKEMEEKPTLISNLIQYTPANIMMNLIEGANVKNGDLLFGALQEVEN